MPTLVKSNIFSVTVLKKGGQFGHNNSSNEIRSSSSVDNNSGKNFLDAGPGISVYRFYFLKHQNLYRNTHY